jgi:hypothetical protein
MNPQQGRLGTVWLKQLEIRLRFSIFVHMRRLECGLKLKCPCCEFASHRNRLCHSVRLYKYVFPSIEALGLSSTADRWRHTVPTSTSRRFLRGRVRRPSRRVRSRFFRGDRGRGCANRWGCGVHSAVGAFSREATCLEGPPHSATFAFWDDPFGESTEDDGFAYFTQSRRYTIETARRKWMLPASLTVTIHAWT